MMITALLPHVIPSVGYQKNGRRQIISACNNPFGNIQEDWASLHIMQLSNGIHALLSRRWQKTLQTFTIMEVVHVLCIQ